MPEDLRLVTLLRLCETISSAILLLFAVSVPLSWWTAIFCVEAMAAFYIAMRLPKLRSPWVPPVILATLVLVPIVIRFAEGFIPVAISTYLLLIAQVVAVVGSVVYGRRQSAAT
jgi:hypothetical protein